MKCIVGIDLGGTNLRMGTVWENGWLDNYQIQSSQFLSEERAADLLVQEIQVYLNGYNLGAEVQAITIGVPSSVSKDKKRIYSTPNIRGLDNVNLTDKLEQYFHIPVYLDRDVNFLLMNDIEHLHLDTSLSQTILGMYLGTGFGNAIYIDGKIYEGKNGVAGELGHIPLYGVADTCACGNKGCSETRASGRYLAHIRETLFSNTSFENLFLEHGQSEELVKFVDDVGLVIAIEINLLDPDHVILAGGVISMSGFPKQELIKAINKRLRRPYPYEDIHYLFTEHTQQSGIYGGYYYIKNDVNKNKKIFL